MKIFNAYENVLKEEQNTQGIESCMKFFGNELFGDQFDGKEPNTNIENKTIDDIRKYTSNSFGTQLGSDNPTIIAKLNKLRACISQYPEILHPSGEKVYRGFSLPLNVVLNIFKRTNGKSPFKMPYHPKYYIESWTETRDVGLDFASGSESPWVLELGGELEEYDNQSDEMKIELINEAYNGSRFLNETKVGFLVSHDGTPDLFLFKAEYFRQLSSVHHENEILGIGSKPFTCLWEYRFATTFMFLIPNLLKYKDRLLMFK